MANLLYVEDDKINALVVSKFLHQHHTVTVANTEQEAMELVKVHDFDLVILDISLGNQDDDGVQLLHKIRAMDHYKDKKIVALTAHALREDREKYLSLGFDDYMSKPIERTFLLQKIDDLINNPVQP